MKKRNKDQKNDEKDVKIIKVIDCNFCFNFQSKYKTEKNKKEGKPKSTAKKEKKIKNDDYADATILLYCLDNNTKENRGVGFHCDKSSEKI